MEKNEYPILTEFCSQCGSLIPSSKEDKMIINGCCTECGCNPNNWQKEIEELRERVAELEGKREEKDLQKKTDELLDDNIIKKNEMYSYRSSLSGYNSHYNEQSLLDRYVESITTIFNTEEESHKYYKIKSKIFKIAKRLGIPTRKDWENISLKKYYLTYGFVEDNVLQSYESSLKGKEIYCLDENFIEELLKEIPREDLVFYTTYIPPVLE